MELEREQLRLCPAQTRCDQLRIERHLSQIKPDLRQIKCNGGLTWLNFP
jgi:hypothetical protein